MGAQTEVRKKLKPKLWRGRTEPCHNSKTRSKVTSTTEAANKNVIIRAISSPSRSRDRNERKPETGPALGTEVVVVPTFSAAITVSCAELSLTCHLPPRGVCPKPTPRLSSVHGQAPRAAIPC